MTNAQRIGAWLAAHPGVHRRSAVMAGAGIGRNSCLYAFGAALRQGFAARVGTGWYRAPDRVQGVTLHRCEG